MSLLRLCGLVLALVCAAPLARAQGEEEPRAAHPGILQEIKNRLSLRDPADIWREARGKARAADALPLMESLAGRGGDSPYAAAAALWLGHYHYGTGAVATALGDFDQAAGHATREAEREEARFWADQCRNLLGERPAISETASPRSVDGILAEVARHDGQLRLGEFNAALSGYLGLEGAARDAGCLGPLLYRVGLAAASRGAGGPPIDWSLIRRWEPSTATSPERALVSALAATAHEAPETLPPAEEPALAEGTASEFAQTSSAVPGDTLPSGESGAAAEEGRAPEPGAGAPGAGAPDARAGARADSPAGSGSVPGAAAYSVQLGAFRSLERARGEMERLVSRGLSVRLDRETTAGVEYFKIRLGRTGSSKEAEDLARRLCQGLDWQVVRITP